MALTQLDNKSDYSNEEKNHKQKCKLCLNIKGPESLLFNSKLLSNERAIQIL